MAEPVEQLSCIQNRRLEQIVQVQLAPLAADIGYAPHALVQAALPYRNSKKLKAMDAWMVDNGKFSLIVQPGFDRATRKRMDYPTGSLPRLLMFWMATEAKKKGKPRLELGGSFREFLEKLNLHSKNGGRNSSAQRLKEQMRRLFRAHISFEYHDATGNVEHERWLDMQIAPKGQVMWSDMYPDTPTLFENWIELGEYFFEAITEHAVPVDMRVLKAIQNAPMALDLYNWLTYRSYAAWRRNKTQKVPWPSIYQQLGSSYNEVRKFRKYAREHLKLIEQLYPDIRLEEADNCLLIKPARPSVIPQNHRLSHT
ncbi:MAG: replication protein RepA [Cyanobacteria bacterium P01_D01_bin.56]